MDFKIERKTVENVDLKYFELNVWPRYTEDAEINGEEDKEMKNNPQMPFLIKEGSEYRWNIIIDLETGNVVDWPKGVIAGINYKVCDEGKYSLLDSEKNVIVSKECYVPKLASINDPHSYGDYIGLDIDENGHIKDWPDKERLYELINELNETDSF